MLKQADIDVVVLKLKQMLALGMSDPKTEHMKAELGPIIKEMTAKIQRGEVEPGVRYNEITPLIGVAMVGEMIDKRLRQAIRR